MPVALPWFPRASPRPYTDLSHLKTLFSRRFASPTASMVWRRRQYTSHRAFTVSSLRRHTPLPAFPPLRYTPSAYEAL